MVPQVGSQTVQPPKIVAVWPRPFHSFKPSYLSTNASLLCSVGVAAFTGGAWQSSGADGDGGLAMLRYRHVRNASAALGPFEEVSADWAAAGGGGLPVTTSVRLGGDGRAAVFAVSFPQGAGGTAAQGYQNCALLGALGVRLAAWWR